MILRRLTLACVLALGAAVVSLTAAPREKEFEEFIRQSIPAIQSLAHGERPDAALELVSLCLAMDPQSKEALLYKAKISRKLPLGAPEGFVAGDYAASLKKVASGSKDRQFQLACWMSILMFLEDDREACIGRMRCLNLGMRDDMDSLVEALSQSKVVAVDKAPSANKKLATILCGKARSMTGQEDKKETIRKFLQAILHLDPENEEGLWLQSQDLRGKTPADPPIFDRDAELVALLISESEKAKKRDKSGALLYLRLAEMVDPANETILIELTKADMEGLDSSWDTLVAKLRPGTDEKVVTPVPPRKSEPPKKKEAVGNSGANSDVNLLSESSKDAIKNSPSFGDGKIFLKPGEPETVVGSHAMKTAFAIRTHTRADMTGGFSNKVGLVLQCKDDDGSPVTVSFMLTCGDAKLGVTSRVAVEGKRTIKLERAFKIQLRNPQEQNLKILVLGRVGLFILDGEILFIHRFSNLNLDGVPGVIGKEGVVFNDLWCETFNAATAKTLEKQLISPLDLIGPSSHDPLVQVPNYFMREGSHIYGISKSPEGERTYAGFILEGTGTVSVHVAQLELSAEGACAGLLFGSNMSTISNPDQYQVDHALIVKQQGSGAVLSLEKMTKTKGVTASTLLKSAPFPQALLRGNFSLTLELLGDKVHVLLEGKKVMEHDMGPEISGNVGLILRQAGVRIDRMVLTP